MDLRQLTTFRMVARTLSFTRTAAALNYVQSSVTAQIQALEEELGVLLFHRLGKRITLTDAGERLLDYATRILALADEARATVAGTSEPEGSLTVSAPESLLTYRLPEVMRAFRARYPLVRLLVRPYAYVDQRRGVSEGALDVAFEMEEALPSTSLVVEPLLSESLVIIAPPNHPLTASRAVVPADLEGEALLLTDVGCSYRNLFERRLAAAGVQPTTVLEFTSVEAIKQCVMVGMGLAILPEVAVASEIAEGRLAALKWATDDLRVMTQMIWHKEKWVSPALSAFLMVTREMLTGATLSAEGTTQATSPIAAGAR